MPLMRNPFRNRPLGDQYYDENVNPAAKPVPQAEDSDPQKKSWSATKPLSIRSNSDRSSNEYKLSEINDSGVYLPPSPPEKRPGMWSRTSTRSSSHRSQLNENEPFNISRESFDSYRRSFDISARSPILDGNPQRARGSLDSRSSRLPPSSYPYQHPPTYPQPPLTPLSDYHVNPPESQPDDRFEDVALDDPSATRPTDKHPSRRRGLFSRFGESEHGATTSDTTSTSRPSSSSGGGGVLGGHSFFGRKRGHSGQGAELGSVNGTVHSKRAVETPPPPPPEVKVDS